MCCSCFMNTKYECLKCKIPICNQCSVFEENEEVDGWKAGSSVAFCEPCDIEVRRAQGITPEEQSIDSLRSKKEGKDILPRYHKHIYWHLVVFSV